MHLHVVLNFLTKVCNESSHQPVSPRKEPVSTKVTRVAKEVKEKPCNNHFYVVRVPFYYPNLNQISDNIDRII